MNIETLSALADKKIDTADGRLKDFRETHLALFKKNGFKEVTQDSYKFTNLGRFFDSVSFEPKNFDGELPSYPAPFPTITFVDGQYSATGELPVGLTVKKISEHFGELKDSLKESNSASHLHHTFFGEGLLIEVSKECEILEPIRILNILTKSTFSAPTHLVVAHKFSKLTVIEETRAFEASHAQVSETYIVAHPGSNVEHIIIDQESSKGLHHGSVFAEIAQDAQVKSFIFHTTGMMNRTNLELNLNAQGANAESYALFLTQGTEHSDINTVINHKAADTTSAQIAKGILDNESKGVFTGKIHIFPKAQRVNSSQLNKNLLLSKKAQVHSQPQLEIFADDVKCSHGSTTGQLSDDEVFYFQARGIPADKAKTILAYGFGLEVVQKIENKVAKEHVGRIVMENLNQKFALGGLK